MLPNERLRLLADLAERGQKPGWARSFDPLRGLKSGPAHVS